MGTVSALGRSGMAARGVLYAVIGLLAGQIALGDVGEDASGQGALRTIAEQPLGTVLLAVLAAGLATYALWRFAQAAFASAADGERRLRQRVADAGRGVVYAGLCALAVPILFGGGGGGGNTEEPLTARVLSLPGGRIIVAAVGLAILGVGLGSAFHGLSGRFRRQLRGGAGTRASRWVAPLAVVGLATRGVAFALVGGFVVSAAVTADPDRAAGLDEALQRIAGEPWGSLAIGLVSLGLLAYAAFCLALVVVGDTEQA